MTKEWVEKKNKEEAEQFKDYPKAIIDFWINANECIKDKASIKTEIAYLALCVKYNKPLNKILFFRLHIACEMKIYSIMDEDLELINFYTTMSEMCENYYNFLCGRNSYYLYEDSDIITFDGDIIITDPCYLSTGLDWEIHEDYREKTFKELGILGETRSTLYGDWSCTTFDMNTKTPLGNFCADGGEVCIALLSDVIKLNPKFDYHIEKPWTTTLIKDFCGTAQIKIEKNKDDEFYCYVEGHGINKITNEPIDFITAQTGL